MSGALSAMIAAAFAGGGAPPVVSDPYFEYTTLLLPGNGTNGAQNNTFLDSSTNNFTITRNGNTTQGTFSPFSQTGWGNYFSGSGQYLTFPNNAAFQLTTANPFCVESWIYPTALANSDNGVIAKRSAGIEWQFGVKGSGAGANDKELLFYTNATSYLSGTKITGTNVWTHIACTWDGTTLRFFIDGNLCANTYTTTFALSAPSTNTLSVGANGSSELFTGYLSNLRFVKGSAVYTSAFTPSTTPLTNISNTSLLTCQSNRFVDNSTANSGTGFTPTITGSPSVQAFSPFNPTSSWSAATNGGSGYFDGNGDYLTTPSTTAVAFPGDWTIEMWYYPLASYSSGEGLFNFSDDKDNLDYGSSTNSLRYYNGSGTTTFTGVSLTTLSWNHVALVNSSGTVRVYVNGVQSTNSVSGPSTSSARTMYILANRFGTNLLNAYVSSFRVVKGTAVYTAAFTPPTAPLTAITNTSILLNYTNAGIYDATSKNDLETVGNAQISTAISAKWGSGCMAFDGTGDYLYGPTSRMLVLGSGDFTVEGWFYFSSVASGVLLDWRSDGEGFDWYLSSGALNLSKTGTYYGGSSGLTLATGQWYHLALTRSGTSWRIYANGTSYANITNSTNFTATILRVGYGANGNYLNGYLQDLRITPGYARYTGASYTVPTAAFPTL